MRSQKAHTADAFFLFAFKRTFCSQGHQWPCKGGALDCFPLGNHGPLGGQSSALRLHACASHVIIFIKILLDFKRSTRLSPKGWPRVKEQKLLNTEKLLLLFYKLKKKKHFLLAVIWNKNKIFNKQKRLFLFFKNQNNITIFVFLCFSNLRFAALWLFYEGSFYAPSSLLKSKILKASCSLVLRSKTTSLCFKLL